MIDISLLVCDVCDHKGNEEQCKCCCHSYYSRFKAQDRIGAKRKLEELKRQYDLVTTSLDI